MKASNGKITRNTVYVRQLSLKTRRGEPSRSRPSLTLTTGIGIDSDVHALAGSPRQVLLVGRRTLDDLDLQPGDLRENLLIEGEIEGFRSGEVLRVGSEALIRLMFSCEPCGNLEKIRPGLAKTIGSRRGMLGMVVRGGRIDPGDEVVPTDYRFPTLSDTVRERFHEFVARIPLGKVVRTSDLLLALGVSRAYYRTLPAFLKRATPDLPVHRLVSVDGGLFEKYLPAHAGLLCAEGVELTGERVAGKDYYWDTGEFHDLVLESDR
ncbi:MOSC domain-containing protein [Pannus brasiliensis CCIBt3594]|uniref:MOSC domain-containing protein n=1 Tax=Pannus brasiliensis CCIBt3594 TaxID=1427578 RepID=A0AAW9QL91_9CHRO